MHIMTIAASGKKPWLLLLLSVAGASLASPNLAAGQQIAPLAPKWLAGTPPPPVETFADGLQRHHIDTTEPALIEALRNPDGEARSLAAAQLAAVDDHPALPQILHAMEDERDPQVLVNLAGAATWLGSRRALDQLQEICQNINMPALARLDAARYVSNKELTTCFSAVDQIERADQTPDIRVQALVFAASYRGEQDKARDLAVYALADIEPSVRLAAIDALHHLRATNALPALDRSLQSESDNTVREHLRETIRILGLAEKEDREKEKEKSSDK